MSEEAIFSYKVDNVYAPQAEAGICWNDEVIAIKWPIDPKLIIASEKDLNAATLKTAQLFD
jgi:dTDP-4-dehydrorhamnose 3,5-epimerase